MIDESIWSHKDYIRLSNQEVSAEERDRLIQKLQAHIKVCERQRADGEKISKGAIDVLEVGIRHLKMYTPPDGECLAEKEEL